MEREQAKPGQIYSGTKSYTCKCKAALLLQKTEYTDENSKYSLYEYTYNNISQTTHTRITSDRIFNYFYTYDSKGRPDEYTYPTDLTIKNEYNPDNGILKK
jgi:hypothetical protein